ncbi:MAG: dienelactone hydrolase family protein [Brevinematales bacterium]|jgi:carboxymethylenebutenolidase
MSIKGEWIKYGNHAGYFAFPDHASLPLPGVIVIQEIGGVNNHIQDVTRRIAAAGYAALAPDLFSVNGVRPESLSDERIRMTTGFMFSLPPEVRSDPAKRTEILSRLPESDRNKINETYGEIFDSREVKMAGYMEHLKSALHHLKHGCKETMAQDVACVGFCMGGGLSALLACEEPGISGAAVFYGQTPPEDKIEKLNCPVIGFYGGNDQRVNAGIPAFIEAAKKFGKSYEHHIYDGAGHAFFNDDALSYNVKAARDSFARLTEFFSGTLSG